MWWTRHQGRSRWSRSGRERWRGWGTHRRRTGMRRSCDSAWHRLSNFENLVGNTVDNHSEGGMLYVFSSNQGLYLSPWVRSLHWINLFKKNGTFQLNSQTNLFSVKKLTSTVFLSFRVSSSTIGTFNPKEFKIICQKRKNISRKGSTFRCNVSHLNFKQIGGEETNCLKQAFWAFLPPTSSRGTCRFSHYLFINININF